VGGATGSAAANELSATAKKLGAGAKQFSDAPTLSCAAPPSHCFVPNLHDEAVPKLKCGADLHYSSTEVDVLAAAKCSFAAEKYVAAAKLHFFAADSN